MKIDWDNAKVRNQVAHIAWDAHVSVLEKAAEEAVQDEAPVASGLMRSRVFTKRISGGPGGLTIVRVIVDTTYAWIVHEGRREVRPLGKESGGSDVLRWLNKLGGAVYSMKSKAVAPNRFIVRGLTKLGLSVKRST